MNWINCEDQMPPPEKPVLILLGGEPHIGALFWEHPGYEEGQDSFLYWDDPNDDGQGWEHDHITHWMEIPKLPGADEGIDMAFYYTKHPERRPPVIDLSDDGIPF